jgi:hypothetical protein
MIRKATETYGHGIVLHFVQRASHGALSQHAAQKIMPRKTTETVGPCAVPGLRFENWPSTVRTAGVTDCTVQYLQLQTMLLQCSICRFVALGTHTDRQTWLSQGGVSEPRGQPFEKAETVRARAVRTL